MNLLEPILVPFDGSPHAHAAAAHARLIAGRTGARAELVYASTAFGRTAGEFVAATNEAEAMLEEEAKLFRGPVDTRLLEGRPPEIISAEAERIHAGLVVLGTRGRSVAEGLLLGSVARHVLRACTRPVMVVHQPAGLVRRIVVGVDGGPGNEALVRVARAVADATGAGLTLVNVVDTDPAVARHPRQFGIPEEIFREAVIAHGENLFRPLRPFAGPDTDERVVYGLPVDQLREIARLESADIVAVCRRGVSGRDVDAWFSVAFALAIKGPFATLVV